MPYFEQIRTLGDLSRFHAKERPDDVALIYGDRTSTYADWDRRCSQAANALIAEGVKPQSRIAYLDKNSDHYFEVLGGAGKANAVVVGVNWRLAPPEIAYIVNDAEAEVLFVGPEFFPAIEKIEKDLRTVKKIVTVRGDHDRWPRYEAWRDAQGDTDPKVHAGPDDVAIQMYTSGTTGNPKGVQLTNFNFFATRRYQNDLNAPWAEWYPEDTNLVAMPIFHIGGTGAAVAGLYSGSKNVILSEFVPSEVLDVIQKYRVSKLFLVPAAIQFLLLDPKCAETDFSCVDYIMYGASPIPLDLLRKAMETFRCDFVQLYGMTETTGLGTYLPPEDHDPNGNERMRSAGKPWPGMEIAILDDDGNKLPPRQVGEICIRSDANMKGYWKLPEATEKTIIDGWVHTGDAGYLDEDGYVYIHDRVKDMIVSGGENIYPAEVENAIYGHPAVQEVAVIGVPDDRWGEAVKACVVKQPDADVKAEDIIAFAKEKIASYKVPKSVDFIDALPRNPSGKILKKELREPYWEGRERRVN